MNVNKEITSKEHTVCQDHIDICQYHQASLENSQFNSNYIYNWGGTDEAIVCILVNFHFLVFYIPFLFIMISERVFHFVDRTDQGYKCVDFFLDFKEFFFSNKITIFSLSSYSVIRSTSSTYEGTF